MMESVRSSAEEWLSTSSAPESRALPIWTYKKIDLISSYKAEFSLSKFPKEVTRTILRFYWGGQAKKKKKKLS